jgi:alpha-beta hydrolase superfamily lysophospholipase
MIPAHVVQLETPKKFILNGLWFGPKRPQRVVIFIHGLTGSAFSMSALTKTLIDTKTAVVTFNNRGFEQVGEIKQKKGKKSHYVRAGAAHEVFADADDDIKGAINLAKKYRVKEIYLAGHSTGAQKAYYWASKNKKETKVKGIILLGPLRLRDRG